MHFFVLPVLQTRPGALPAIGRAPNTEYGLEIGESAY